MLLVSGSAYLFYGYERFAAITCLSGGYIFGLTAIFILNLIGASSLGDSRDLICFIVVLCSVALGFILLFFLQMAAPGAMGLLLGFVIGVLILQIGALSAALPVGVRGYLFCGGLAVVFAIISFFLEDVFRILGTSVIGAFVIMTGIDYWVKSGFGVLVYSALYDVSIEYNVKFYAMLSGYFVLMLFALVMQVYHKIYDVPDPKNKANNRK
jgi:hypothetical protein